MISNEIFDAIRLLNSLSPGDRVTVTDGGKTYDMTVSFLGTRRSDGAYGSIESTHTTVTFGPGRYSFEVRAELLASGKQALVRS